MKQACAGHSYHVLPIHPTAIPLFILSRVATCFSYMNVQLNLTLDSYIGLIYIGVLGRNDPGRNDPETGADRPSTWSGTTAFGADVGRIDPGWID